jgi:hypothetical protein
MPPATRWIHKLDGVDLNDIGAGYMTIVPEVLNAFGAQVLLTEMQARTPVFNRQQPVAGRWTFLVTIVFDDDAQYATRRAALEALVAPGAHTYEPTAPGGSSPLFSSTVYFDGGLSVDDTDTGRCTARAIVPSPAI